MENWIRWVRFLLGFEGGWWGRGRVWAALDIAEAIVTHGVPQVVRARQPTARTALAEIAQVGHLWHRSFHNLGDDSFGAFDELGEVGGCGVRNCAGRGKGNRAGGAAGRRRAPCCRAEGRVVVGRQGAICWQPALELDGARGQ